MNTVGEMDVSWLFSKSIFFPPLNILQVLACLIVVVEKDAILLDKNLDTCHGSIQIQQYACEFL